MEAFDAAIVDELSKVPCKGDIKATCSEYKNMQEFWCFNLLDAQLTFDKKDTMPIKKLAIYTVKS